MLKLPLVTAPHRVFFFAGAIQMLLTVVVWLGLLMGVWATSFSASALHAWLMVYGVFPFFILGFLFTALPNWVSGTGVSASVFVASALSMSVGAALFYVGLGDPLWLLPALLLHGAGWALAVWALMRVLQRAKPQDKRQPWLTWWALSLGLLGDVVFMFGVAGESEAMLAAAASIGLWLFLAPLFLAVCHRMVPWFTSRVITNYVVVRPYMPLWAMMVACLAHLSLELAGLKAWLWLADLPLTVLAVWFISRWGIARSLHVRLLAMLHIAFVWSAIAFALYTLASVALLLGWEWNIGRAPVHALGMGFFGAMLIGMASRVSLGHSGRGLECDATTWWIFLAIQVGALLRIVPEMIPAASSGWVLASGGVWLLALGLWVVKYTPMTWQTRVDGKPG